MNFLHSLWDTHTKSERENTYVQYLKYNYSLSFSLLGNTPTKSERENVYLLGHSIGNEVISLYSIYISGSGMHNENQVELKIKNKKKISIMFRRLVISNSTKPTLLRSNFDLKHFKCPPSKEF